MNENDYKYALLLQKQLEYESANEKTMSSDSQLAVVLQQQFQEELSIENPGGDLVYDKKKNLNNSKCLTDPSWELVDPTPDIHILFVAFNKKFFWNQLLTVCVSWSKRMTTCAGICSYQGRGGLCSITLSEPLLKLRPRKDLIETLLHEMIHAYLFVTNNNRDRDGHGPEFHKHMYRINQEAGTNITVYHNFHDEVRLYQQHWWRCNGPCQYRKPYFGLVRRSINRAPGPYDFWWGEHTRSCGGNFIKIKEPEKKAKSPKKLPLVTSPKNDIRNYFVPTKTKQSVPKSSKAAKNLTSQMIENGTNHTYVPGNGNIVGFNNLNKPKMNTNTKGNLNNTVVIQKKLPQTVVKEATKSTNISAKSTNVNAFNGTSQVLSSTSTKDDDYSVVRNHWINKYSTDNANKKRPSAPALPSNYKKSKTNTGNCISCPLCNVKVNSNDLNKHMDDCLESSSCFNCDKRIANSEINEHISKCLQSNFVNNDFITEMVECEVCNERIAKDNIEEHKSNCMKECVICSKKIAANEIIEHTSQCLESSFQNDDFNIDNNQINENITSNEKEVEKFVNDLKCPMCNCMFDASSYGKHVESCLHKIYDDIEKRNNIPVTNNSINCLVCGKKLLKNELNNHLDECILEVFDDKTEENTSDTQDSKLSAISYNCPVCMQLFLETEMNAHLDICLK